MDVLPSSQFRKRYPNLERPTSVTVHGHVIGEWVPVRSSRYQTIQEVKATIAGVRADAAEVMAEQRFNTRPFTPVPKKR